MKGFPMITLVFSVYDEKAQAFMQPFFAHSRGLAVRQLSGISDPEHPFVKWPEDFRLYCLGHFDDARGVIVASDQPDLVCDLCLIYSKE